MQVRYMATFPADHTMQPFRELALSLLTLETFVAPHIDLDVVIHTAARFHSSISAHCAKTGLQCRVVPLEALKQNREDVAFANSLKNLTYVDRLCVIRMLSDFAVLDPTRYRLLLGADVTFLSPPSELIEFVQGGSGVLYMRDHYSTKGPHRIRYFEGPTMESLLGDFYCLAPGVQLERREITDCLQMIDAWPTSPSRFDPALPEDWTTPEQQAASILLAPFGGYPLSTERYAHASPGEVVMHTHNLYDATIRLPDGLRERYAKRLGFNRMRHSENPRGLGFS